MAVRAIVDFQRGIRWSSKGDNIRGTRAAKWLKRDKIMEIRWFGSSKEVVSSQEKISYSLFVL